MADLPQSRIPLEQLEDAPVFGRLVVWADYLFGGLALGLVGSYFSAVVIYALGLVANFSAFFVSELVPLTLFPALTLGLSVGYRMCLPGLLFRMGAKRDLAEYSMGRLDVSWTRSWAEVAVNRIARSRLLYELEEFDAGIQLLEPLDSDGSVVNQWVGWRVTRWLAEGYFSNGKLDECRRLLQDVDWGSRLAQKPALLACRAELAVRLRNKSSWTSFLEDARWHSRDDVRVQMAHLYGLVVFGNKDLDWTKAEEVLKNYRDLWVESLPHRRTELRAMEALILAHIGEVDKARTIAEEITCSDGEGQFTAELVEHAQSILDRHNQQ
jgi:hypothetical protein